MSDQQEKKNKVVALLYSMGVHIAVLLLVFFVVSWKAPNPPLGELGVDLNIGLDTEGSGDVQPDYPVGSEKVTTEKAEETKPEDKQQEEAQPEITKPVETQPEKNIATSDDPESPVSIKEKKEDVKPVEKPVVEKPKEKVVEKPIAVYQPAKDVKTDAAKTDAAKTTGGDRVGKPGNQGDDVNKAGDKGDPRGTVDGKAMYGDPGNGGGGGGGNGPSLDISGWNWDEKPNPQVPNNETGQVVFQIEVDDSGEIIKITTLQRSISIEAEKACRLSVQKLTFTKTGTKVPPISTGKITFVIRSK